MENNRKETITERIGVYGGTFSPPHLGHLHAARAFLEGEEMDKLLVIPTHVPPHKTRTESTSSADRLAMCRLAFSFSPRIEVSDMEIIREGKSYTSDTLRALSREGRRLIFLCGTDMFLTLGKWHEPETVFALADIVCMRREDDPALTTALTEKAAAYRKTFGAVIRFLQADAIELSSGSIRERIAAKEEWKTLLPPHVAAYIEERGLYR